MVVKVRQVVLVRPTLNLSFVAVGTPIAIGSAAIPFL